VIPSAPDPLATAPPHTLEQSTMLAAIVESCDDGIASKDLRGIVTSWNASAERIFGYKAHEIIGRPITLIIPPELQDDEKEILAKIVRGERIEHFETIRVTKDGRRINVALSISPVRDARGQIIGAAKVVRDITETKRAQEALRRAEKLAAAGQLAATIAHEINNPMQAVSNLLSLLSFQKSLDSETRKLVEMAEIELRRMSHISRQMLSFYRESLDAAPVSLTEALDDVLSMFERQLQKSHVTIERDYRFRGWIRAYPVEVRQLFANLISNAVEALPPGGRITVRTRASRNWKTMLNGVTITVADNGPGIPAAIRKNLFEPFFTTKQERGTGLGLWVVRGLISKHEGTIRFRSSADRKKTGTVFSVFLPAERAQDERQ
jgi:two-component system, chemotaxis family, CheB/CheR fusion protein